MRITFVLPYAGLSGGIRVIAIYAERLRQRGHDVTVVSWPRRPKSRLLQKLMRLGRVDRVPHGPSHMRGAKVEWRVIERRRPVVDSDVPDADVVIATWWETAEWVAKLSKEKGVKVHFVQGHEVFPEQPQDRVRAAYRLPLEKITIAKWLVDTLQNEYGVKTTWLVPNAVDHDQFYAKPRGRQKKPTIGFLYNPTWIKGIDVMLQATSLIQARVPDLQIVTFGASRITKLYPIPENTSFTLNPPQQFIREIYSKLDVWMCGSRTEGFHLMPLEAMACYTPVVGTKVGGCVETIIPGVNGYLVNVEDPQALADSVLKVLNLDEHHWRELSSGAAQTAKMFTWDQCTDWFEAALEQIVRKELNALDHSIR